MLLKNPKKKTHGIDDKVLCNKILVIGLKTQGGFESFAYTITLQAVLDYVCSVRDAVPRTVEELVIEYGKDEIRLQAADIVEVYADQEEADKMNEMLCDKANAVSSQQSIEWLVPQIIGSYLHAFLKELPEEPVEYFR